MRNGSLLSGVVFEIEVIFHEFDFETSDLEIEGSKPSTQLRVTRLFFLSLLPRNFDDRLSSILRYTKWEDNYYQLPIMSSVFKGPRCLGSVELVFSKRLKPFVIKCIGKIDNFKVEYNDPHNHATRLHSFTFKYTSRRTTVGHFVQSKCWLHKIADRASSRRKRKTVQFRVILVWINYILLLKYLTNHMHFITNGLKCFFLKTNSSDTRQRVPFKVLRFWGNRLKWRHIAPLMCHGIIIVRWH